MSTILERQLAGSISLGRQARAAKGLRDAWARVQRAEAARDRHRHTSNPTADAELAKAREAFCAIAGAALGLETSNVVALRTTISDEDSE